MERIIEHAKHVIRSRFSLNEGQMLYLLLGVTVARKLLPRLAVETLTKYC